MWHVQDPAGAGLGLGEALGVFILNRKGNTVVSAMIAISVSPKLTGCTSTLW